MTTISTKNIARTVYEITKDKNGKALEDTLSKVTDYFIKKRLITKTSDILNKLQNIIDQENKTVEIKMSVRKPLSKNEQENIEEYLKKRYKAKAVTTKILEDKDILGGVRIEARDEVIDLTLRNKINQLHKHLIAN